MSYKIPAVNLTNVEMASGSVWCGDLAYTSILW